MASLDDLVVDADLQVKYLQTLANPIKKSFLAEALSIPSSNDGHEAKNTPQNREVLLADRMSEFQELRKQKEKILKDLWDERESIQLKLVGLAAEVCGRKAITIGKEQNDEMKAGQRALLDQEMEIAQGLHNDSSKKCDNFNQALNRLKRVTNQTIVKTKKDVIELHKVSRKAVASSDHVANLRCHQQHHIQKSKLVKGLHRHMELLASL